MLSILLLLKVVCLFAEDGKKGLHEECVDSWSYYAMDYLMWDTVDDACSGDLKCAKHGHTLQGITRNFGCSHFCCVSSPIKSENLGFNQDCWNDEFVGKDVDKNKNDGFWQDLDNRCEGEFVCSRKEYSMRSPAQSNSFYENFSKEKMTKDMVDNVFEYVKRDFGCDGWHCCTLDNHIPPSNSLNEGDNCWVEAAVGDENDPDPNKFLWGNLDKLCKDDLVCSKVNYAMYLHETDGDKDTRWFGCWWGHCCTKHPNDMLSPIDFFVDQMGKVVEDLDTMLSNELELDRASFEITFAGTDSSCVVEFSFKNYFGKFENGQFVQSEDSMGGIFSEQKLKSLKQFVVDDLSFPGTHFILNSVLDAIWSIARALQKIGYGKAGMRPYGLRLEIAPLSLGFPLNGLLATFIWNTPSTFEPIWCPVLNHCPGESTPRAMEEIIEKNTELENHILALKDEIEQIKNALNEYQQKEALNM